MIIIYTIHQYNIYCILYIEDVNLISTPTQYQFYSTYIIHIWPTVDSFRPTTKFSLKQRPHSFPCLLMYWKEKKTSIQLKLGVDSWESDKIDHGLWVSQSGLSTQLLLLSLMPISHQQLLSGCHLGFNSCFRLVEKLPLYFSAGGKSCFQPFLR